MENSHIAWTNHTFNPWIGCTKVSSGCTNCYAEDRDKRFADGVHWGKDAPRQRTSAGNWHEPVKWNKAAQTAEAANTDRFEAECAAYDGACYKALPRPRVFCASLSDWLDDEVPIEWLADLLALIHATPNLDWLMLTKRPENFRDRIAGAINHLSTGPATTEAFALITWLQGWQSGNRVPANVWLGTSVENQRAADLRIPILLETPAKIRFLSCEPLLEPVNLNAGFKEGPQAFPLGRGIHWVIVGGESGKHARPFDLRWGEKIIDQCRAHGTPVFMKQLGAKAIGYNGSAQFKTADPKGGAMHEWPEYLRIREFPK